ncbi:hypothetical protein C8R43DRAFT_1175198 [Mycena crocata]|nr:hypothetical protein C8R43DRAFT_1175198 [Mycena crocata]
MTSQTPWKPQGLFRYPGSWLHLAIGSSTFSEQLVTQIETEFDHLAMNDALEGEETAASRAALFLQAVQNHSLTGLNDWASEKPYSRPQIEQFMSSEITTITERNARSFISIYLPPLIFCDILLNVVDPAAPAPILPRAHTQPTIEKKLLDHIRGMCNWRSLLRSVHVEYLRMVRYRAKETKKSNQKPSRKAEYLKFLKSMNNETHPGSKATWNVDQVTYLMGLYMMGGLTLSLDTMINYSVAYVTVIIPHGGRDAARRGIVVTVAEVKGTLTRPNIQRILAPFLIGAAVTPIAILRDDVGYSASQYADPIGLIQAWRSSGNAHLQGDMNALAPINRFLWRLLIERGLYMLGDAFNVMEEFFSCELVQAALAVEVDAPDNDLLLYPTDLLEDPQLLTMDPIREDSDEGEIDETEDSSGELSLPTERSQSGPTVASVSATKSKSKDLPNKDNIIPLSAKTRSQSSPSKAVVPPSPDQAESTTRPKRVQANKKSGQKRAPRSDQDSPYHADIQFLAIYDSAHPIEERVHEAKRLRDGFKDPKKALNLTAIYPLVDEAVVIKVYAPTADLNKHISKEYAFRPFQSAEFDSKTVTEMLSTQILLDNGLPLHLQPNARDSNPKIKPGPTQSCLYVTTALDFQALDAFHQQELHRHRCILMIDVPMEPDPGFTEESLSRFGDPYALTEIQGRLVDLLENPDRILNALQNTLPSAHIPQLPPGWSAFATHERAVTHTAYNPALPMPTMPWQDLVWGIIANSGAKSAAHGDTAGTYMMILTGSKIIVLGIPRDDLDDSDHRGNYSSRHAFKDWNSAFSNKEFVRWEFLFLQRGMVLVMRATTAHFVISIEPCIAYGLHAHYHASARWLLVRIFIFQATNIIAARTPLHVPRLAEKEGLWDLLTLQSFVIIYCALDGGSYQDIANRGPHRNALPMSSDRFQELMHAWKLVCQLEIFLDSAYELESNDARYRNFRDITNHAVITMACCMVRYQKSWESQQWKADETPSAEGFTHKAFLLQLRRSLGAFDSIRNCDTQVVSEDPLEIFSHALESFDDDQPLTKLFNAAEATDDQFDFFLPWTADSMPFALIPATPESTSNKRKGASSSRDKAGRSKKKSTYTT